MDYTKEEHIFKKKSPFIAAIKWNGENFDEIKKFAGENVYLENKELKIKEFSNKEPAAVAFIGDYLLRNDRNQYCFLNSKFFEENYEIVE